MTDVTFYNKTGADGKFDGLAVRVNATSAHTAANSELVACDTTGGTFAVTLPAASAGKCRVMVKWVAGTAAPTVALSGTDHFNSSSGPTTPLTPQLLNQGYVLESDGSGIWTVTSDDLPLDKLLTLLSATYAGLWQSQTPYTAGQIVRDQFGYMLQASAGFTSALTYSAIEAANWKDVSGKVSPKRFGAAGNGTTDDTSAVQAALNCAVTFGAALLIDARYKTTAALSLPINSTGSVTILAATADSNPFGSTSLDKASIESTGSAVFSQAASGVVVLNMRDVNFRNLGASTATLFTGVTLNTSSIVGCAATKYGYILDSTSGAWQVTRFTGNRFENVGTSWCAGDLVDSFLSNNYFNGDPTKNASFLTGTASTTVISDNYFDFFKRVFDYSFNQYNNAKYDVRVEGNIFDYCWNTLGSSTNQPIKTYKFIGNSWIHCTASAALTYFPNADSDMTGTPWSAISSSNYISNVNVVGNHFMSVDVAIKVTGQAGHFREAGNIYDTFTGAISFLPTSYTTPPDITIEALDEYRLTPTFAAAQTIDWSQGAIQEVTLTANMTSLTFSNAIPHRIYELHFIQDATGGRTLAGPQTNIRWSMGVPVLTTTANGRDVFRFRYDGTNWNEVARSLNVGQYATNGLFEPMGTQWQLNKNGQADWVNGTSSFPFIRITPVFNSGPGTYGGILAGRGNIAPDASMARGNDTNPAWIANVPWLKKTVASTLASNGAVTLAAATGDVFLVTLQANATSFSLGGAATTTGWGQEVSVHFIQDATGSRTLSSPSGNIKWAGGTAPTLSTGANKRDIFTFLWDQTANAYYEIYRSMNVG